MSLSDRLEAPPRRPTGHPCSVAQLRQELPTDEQAAFDRMLWELNWSARRIYEELLDEGYEVGLQTIGRHRRGECRCGKAGA
jgi:hypothetical protein